MPPLVFAGEARDLEAALGEVANGRGFLLQAGECAESFRDFSAVSIREKLKIFLQMSVVMIYGSGLPLVKVGRIAGQFAKPRSQPTERVGQVELPSFFGHMVNDDAPTPEARTPDPTRLLRVYHQSAATLNLVARLHERRLRRSHSGAHVESGVCRELARRAALRGPGRRDRARAGLRPSLRDRRRPGAAAPPRRSVDEPRGSRARLRGSADAAGLADRRLVRLLRAHALDRRADAPAGRRARRVLRRRRKSARDQARADGDRR